MNFEIINEITEIEAIARENGGRQLYTYIKNCVYYVTCMPRKDRIAAPGALHHILWSSDFVEAVLKKANEDLQQKYRLSTSGLNLDTLLKKNNRLLPH